MLLAPNNLLGIQWSSEIFLFTSLTTLCQLPSPIGSTFSGIYLCESYAVIWPCSHKSWPTKLLLRCICLGLCVCAQLLSPVWLFVTPWSIAYQAACPWNFQARILEWVAISFSRDLSKPGTKPKAPALAGRFFTSEPPGNPWLGSHCHKIHD